MAIPVGRARSAEASAEVKRGAPLPFGGRGHAHRCTLLVLSAPGTSPLTSWDQRRRTSAEQAANAAAAGLNVAAAARVTGILHNSLVAVARDTGGGR